MKFRLVSVWPSGSGTGIWFLAELLMLEESLCCSAPPSHPFPAWDLAFKPPHPAGLGTGATSAMEGRGSQEGMQPKGFNTSWAQVFLHASEVGKSVLPHLLGVKRYRAPERNLWISIHLHLYIYFWVMQVTMPTSLWPSFYLKQVDTAYIFM